MNLTPLALAVSIFAGVAAQAEPMVPSQADWEAARQKITTDDGLNLAYVELGTGEGTPLLLHGYTDNSRSWSLPSPYFGDRPIYALDLRGHGASDAPACCYGLDSLAHDVAAFMDAKGIEPADLVGHSLGSMTAAIVAATEPERVNKLVLISSAMRASQGSGDWLREKPLHLMQADGTPLPGARFLGNPALIPRTSSIWLGGRSASSGARPRARRAERVPDV